MANKMTKYEVVVELVLVELVIETSKICQRSKLTEPLEQIFLFFKLKQPFLAYKKPLPKHQSFIILIWKVISKLKIIYLAMPLVESLIN